ncbi:MAG: hypothetical protein GXO54_07125 [Chloroflexi bacterium]|nr:hypothetical protein [Chloroflexota bacterium]
MRRYIWLVSLFILMGLTACQDPWVPTPEDPATVICHQGLLQALDLEISRFEMWLAQETDETQIERYRLALAYLRDLRTRAQKARPGWKDELAFQYIPGFEQGTYGRAPLPETREVTLTNAQLEGPLPAQILYEGQTRSGPFYMATASVPPVEPGHVYTRMVVRLLMPAVYPYPEFYVCILEATP